MFRALSNEARLAIVERLGQGECTVGTLTDLVGLDQSTVSKHLSVLRTLGLVSHRREGNRVWYRLIMTCVLDFIACAHRVCEGKEQG